MSALAPWDVPVESVEGLAGGWNSTTWLVRTAGAHEPAWYVAKLADGEDADAFRGGLRVAGLAASHSLRTGAPVATQDGRWAVELPEGTLALLRYVPGRSPSASSRSDMRRAGRTLARAHLALLDGGPAVSAQHAWPWRWADDCLRTLPMAPGLRGAAARALREARDITARTPLRRGVVHGDPGLDAFRLDDGAPEHDGLIDWAAAMEAPLLYDLAAVAVVTRGTPRSAAPFMTGYRELVPQIRGELRHLDAFVRLRWMCHAFYFAARHERGITRGATAEENVRGLAEAYAGLTDRGGGPAPGSAPTRG
ncbi:phosphotransferase enzyme family protein [Streptomyces sulfonofaciens]|uniref:phosphotransferase enzyme family protein n=1 Tax=Streptomyces sulfonofaciens TaxID=68272 RepID=UPI0016775D2F|nr:phosphotransferase [Streptomyces sulfonofaciens]